MISEHIELFTEDFPGVIPGPEADASLRKELRHRLPASVLDFMEQYGFSGFGDGRFFLTDPTVWQPTVDMFRDALDVPMSPGPLTPFGRSAFGNVYAWSTETGLVTFSPLTGDVFVDDSSDELPQDADLVIGSFFSTARPDSFDFTDESGQWLFDRAVERLGPLSVDEVYGFLPPYRTGGAAVLENLQRVDALAHMVILTDG